ncbi:MAG TPA: aspartate carbamoyltransferase catalytic subunit [Gammaproteobacteria bacterium]|jgi:aspartate carbamoyltransferase catalytic subunit|nr:aspartate carbamoyltransferase catalytic subunit [Gammaproteobacteria bacterium]
MSDIQFDARGHLHHLLTLEGVNRSILTALLDQAERFRVPPGERVRRHTGLAGKTVVNLFFEPSTRTRSSFELAARRLGADVLNLEIALSSAVKGESLEDTLYTLEAMNADIFVVRHKDAGVPALLAQHAAPHVHVLNAGEAHLSHPTQGLLDAFTIRRHKPNLPALSVAIVGDIKHSRVARSAVQALTILGTRDIRLAGPKNLLPKRGEMPGELFTDADKAVAGADVVMMLRIQKERMQKTAVPTVRAYFKRYGLDAARLKKAKPNAIVMHPGPMNRDVEISSEVADGRQSVIREQVNNGVAIRMAVLSAFYP